MAARHDVLDQHGAHLAAVALPEFVAVVFGFCGEEKSAAHFNRVVRHGSSALGVDIQHAARARCSAVADPRLTPGGVIVCAEELHLPTLNGNDLGSCPSYLA